MGSETGERWEVKMGSSEQKYIYDKELGQSILLHGESASDHVSLDVASAIYESGKMTKRIYIDIRLLLKGAGADVLPSYTKLLAFRNERLPTVEQLPVPYRCVKFDYVQCLKLTSALLFATLQSPFQNINEVNMTVHDGLDGSGGHSIFNQRDACFGSHQRNSRKRSREKGI